MIENDGQPHPIFDTLFSDSFRSFATLHDPATLCHFLGTLLYYAHAGELYISASIYSTRWMHGLQHVETEPRAYMEGSNCTIYILVKYI